MSTAPTFPRIGYGAMHLTWTPEYKGDENAFKALKTAIDGGSTMINSGEFYGQPKGTEGLEMLSRFYKAHPEYVEKTFLSVKGAAKHDAKGMSFDSSVDYLRECVTKTNNTLGTKKIDLYECARVDQSRPIEDTIRNMKVLIDEGHFKYIGLTEVGAQTIRRAHAVHPITLVEIEYSLWSLDVEKNGVIDTCKELNIPIVAYSPIGRGALAGKFATLDDLPKDDMRRRMDRFQPENFEHNMKLVNQIKDFANKKKCTSAQLAVAWILANPTYPGGIIPLPGSTRPEGVQENIDAQKVQLTREEYDELSALAHKADIKGGRYFKAHEAMLEA